MEYRATEKVDYNKKALCRKHRAFLCPLGLRAGVNVVKSGFRLSVTFSPVNILSRKRKEGGAPFSLLTGHAKRVSLKPSAAESTLLSGGKYRGLKLKNVHGQESREHNIHTRCTR